MTLIDFAVRFQDLASGPLRSFGQQAQSTFGRAGAAINNLTGRNQVLGQSYNELQERMREVEATIRSSTIPSQIREARRELERLQRQSASHPGGMGGGGAARPSGGGGGGMGVMGLIKGNLLTGGIQELGSMAAGFFADSFSAALERQKIQTSFNVLAGSTAAGEAVTKQLVDLQKNTILGAEVFKNAQTMMGFGFKSTEVLPAMKMLGDVSMGDADKLGSLTLAFAQVRAGGKLTGQDMLQFINAGFNPLEQISTNTGKSMAVLKKEMEGGRISFAMVNEAFQKATSEGGKFNNMLDTIAKTPAGKMAQLSGAWDEFKVKAGEAFMPLITGALELANKLLPIIDGFMKPMGEFISRMVAGFREATTETGGLVSYVTALKDLYVEHVWPVVLKIWGLIRNVAESIYEAVNSSELLKDVFSGIQWIFGFIWDILGYIIDAIGWVWDKLKPVFEKIEIAYRMWKALLGGGKMNLEVNSKGELVLPKEKKEAAKKKTDEKTADQKAAELLLETKKTAEANASSASATESTISGGGPRVLNITVQKFLDTIQITQAGTRESAAEIEAIMSQMFARVLAQGAVANS